MAANNIYEKQLTATHGRIKFKVDGKDVTGQIESKYGSPIFTVHEYGDRSYVPLRSIAELMGMEVKYDDATHTAEIIDTKANQYDAELKKKNAEITKLENEIKKLEKELETYKKNTVEETDLKTLEKEVNKKFGTYENIDFDITLKESKSNITVSMSVDFYNSRQQNYWNRLTNSEKKSMIEDITSMISKEIKNANITGSIYDTYYRGDLLTFSKKSNSNTVSVSYKSTSSNFDDKYLDNLVADELFYNGIGDATISYFDVSSTRVDMEISFSDRYSDEWKSLSNSKIASMLDRISDEVMYDYYNDYYYNDYYDYYDDYDKDVRIDLRMSGVSQGYYYRDYDSNYGTFY